MREFVNFSWWLPMGMFVTKVLLECAMAELVNKFKKSLPP